MNRFLKTLLLWLLMAVLPVQGLAAATKAFCGPTHHSSLPVLSEHQHHHDSFASHSHHHDDSMQHAALDRASLDHSAAMDQSADANNQYKGSYCSACAACCLFAVALPSMLVSAFFYDPSESFVILPAPSITNFISGGLERPPKSISA